MKIKRIWAREILDSRGNPTIEVDLYTDEFMVRASVPSGASTGIHEALELRDNDERYNGKGVLKAVDNINRIIAPKLLGMDVEYQKMIDTLMLQLDGTKNKSKLGANAILGVSMAVCKAGAMSKKLPLFKYINEIAETKFMKMPTPFFNVINGGVHAGNGLDFQEYMIACYGNTFSHSLRIGAEIYHILKKMLQEKYGMNAINVGDEGGFAPPLKDNEEPLKLLVKAIQKAKYEDKVKIALDPAASEFYDKKYIIGKKTTKPKKITGKQLSEIYLKLIKKYPIISIEDAFAQDDWDSWVNFKPNIQVVGDDLLVTNVERIKTALEKNACNALLLKINQIGTISEAIQAANLALGNNWGVMVSHRSGETTEDFIADLVVGLGCGQIKSGAPCRGERLAKYNQLLRIEEMI